MMARDGFIDANNKDKISPSFTGSHWDEPNVLAHIRMDDRVGPNGEKVLHVAEIQSDWHQKNGKTRVIRQPGNPSPKHLKSEDLVADAIAPGHRGERPANRKWRTRLPKGPSLTLNGRAQPSRVGQRNEVSTEAAARELYHTRFLNRNAATENMVALEKSRQGIPDAPFKTSWPELAFKRALRFAAEHGYDRLSWDTGETNADRYDLSKTVSKIDYNPESGKLLGYDKTGAHVLNTRTTARTN